MRIGIHQVSVVKCLGYAQFGGNPQYMVSIDGHEMMTFRQGGIGIWAFRMRYRWSIQEAQEFDTYMDKEHKELGDAGEPGDFGHDGFLAKGGAA